jgi:hypothetical protein
MVTSQKFYAFTPSNELKIFSAYQTNTVKIWKCDTAIKTDLLSALFALYSFVYGAL